MVEYAMTCHSGGTLEIYVEPFLPRDLLVLIGHGPVVEMLAALGRVADVAVEIVRADAAHEELPRLALTQRTSVVVATHGDFDEEALETVLRSEVGYVSLVASRKRAAAIVERLRQRGVPPARIGRLKAPAGLDLGAVTPVEIAVSILAEIVQSRRSQKAAWAETADEARAVSAEVGAKDPVCGMRVEIATARYRSEALDRSFYFCNSRCKETFDRNPERYAADHAG
jgi:xanthine dehydrogenase accessory factor